MTGNPRRAMYVRVVDREGREFTEPCTHTVRTPPDVDGRVRFEWSNMEGGGETVLPDQAQVVYLMNDAGQTIDTIRAPRAAGLVRKGLP